MPVRSIDKPLASPVLNLVSDAYLPDARAQWGQRCYPGGSTVRILKRHPDCLPR
jgi:hypothetical protein